MGRVAAGNCGKAVGDSGNDSAILKDEKGNAEGGRQLRHEDQIHEISE